MSDAGRERALSLLFIFLSFVLLSCWGQIDLVDFRPAWEMIEIHFQWVLFPSSLENKKKLN